MSYRVWPAALLTGAALAAACVVVGDHVVDTRDGCMGSTGWFTATPVTLSLAPLAAHTGRKTAAVKAGIGRSVTVDPARQSSDDRPAGQEQISGCLDVTRIEIPGTAPAPDGRA